MTALWALLIGVLGTLVAVVVLACLMPLRLEIQARRDGAWSGRVALRPFGRYGPAIALHRGASSPNPRPSRKTTKRRRHAAPRKLLRPALTLLSDVLSVLRLEHVRCTARFGCGDPALTGEVFGGLAPFIYSAYPSSRFRLDVEPDFGAEVLEGELELALSVIPARLLGPLVRFSWRAFGKAP